jgi:hypothetical protein
MNLQPAQNSPPTDIKNVASGIADTASSALGSISNSIADARTNLNSAVSDFSSKSAIDASNEFLESNTIVAKFAFIIIALVAFMLLFRLGAIILAYFFMPSKSPYLVKGMISGSESKVIQQDPKTEFPVIQLSDNAETGIELTYSVWLNLSGESTKDSYKNVFNKGTGSGVTITNNEPIPNGTNAPGLYVKTNADNTNSAVVIMDTMESDGSLATSSKYKFVEIKNLPNNKWVNIMIRVQNRILDVYVNGVLTGRKDLEYIPRQNYGPVNVCQGGGFSGKLSDLRYFDSALNVFQINQIVLSGPNTSTSKDSASVDSTGFYYYLSSNFYQSNL